MHANLYRDTTEYGHEAAIFLRIFMTLSHNSNIHELILFKLGTKAKPYDLNMHANLFRDTTEYGREAAIFLQIFRDFEP